MIESIPYVLTGIGIIVSILYYTSVLRNANKTRQTQLFMQLFDRMASEENRLRSLQILQLDFTGYDDFEEKYNMENNSEVVSKVLHVWNELNGMGFLLRKGLVDIETVNHLAGHIVKPQWNKWKRYVAEARINEKEYDFLDDFECLAKEIIKCQETKNLNR